MNKRQWARLTAQNLRKRQQGMRRRALSYGEVEEILDAAMESLKAALQSGEKLSVKGFGSFEVISLPPRLVACNLNPAGPKVLLPARKYLRFQPSRTLLPDTDHAPEE